MKKGIADLPDVRYVGTRVLVRVDFNMPLNNGQILEDYRLRRAMPTIVLLRWRAMWCVYARCTRTFRQDG